MGGILMKKGAGFIFICIGCAFCLSSCFLLNMSALRNSVSPKNFGSPEGKVLIYGSMNFHGNPMHFTEFMQINPANKAKFISPNTRGTNFYFPPADPGDVFNLILLTQDYNRASYRAEYGLQTFNKPVFRAEKPGLQFVGTYNVRVQLQPVILFLKSNDVAELTVLEGIVKDFKGSEWEPLIKARIEELKKDDKK